MIFDIETNHRQIDRVTTIWCICAIDPETDQRWQFGPAEILDGLAVLAQADRLVGHNVSQYDLPVLRRLFGFAYGGNVVDTLVLSRAIFNALSDEPDKHGRHALDAWGARLGFAKGDWSDFSRWDPGMMEYCMRDCELTQRMLDRFRQQPHISRATRLELEYDAFLRRIERHGFTLDVKGTEALKGKLEKRKVRLQGLLDRIFPPERVESHKPSFYTFQPANGQLFDPVVPKFSTKKAMHEWRKAHRIKPREIREIEGPPGVKIRYFNAMSPPQVVKAMRKLGWDPDHENESGSIKTGEAELYQSGIPAGRLIAVFRGYSKLHSFCKQWLAHQQGGKLHPSFLGNRAATGRSASKAPNIQQIPTAKRRKSGMKVLVPYGQRCRELFLPQAGYVLVGADLKGIEVRLLGHRLAPYDDGAFAELVTSGKDFHQHNADLIGISRDHAKTVLYGSMYGMGPYSLAQDLGISMKEARNLIDGLTYGIPGFAKMKTRLVKKWKRPKRIKLIDGRRIQVTKEHKVLNYAIQGDAAILMKHWALESDKRLAGTSFRLLAVVHDEIQSECLPEDAKQVVSALERTATDVGARLGFRVLVEAERRKE